MDYLFKKRGKGGQKMDKETNVERVENMLYSTCGCSVDEAIEILNECLRNARGKKYGIDSARMKRDGNSSGYREQDIRSMGLKD